MAWAITNHTAANISVRSLRERVPKCAYSSLRYKPRIRITGSHGDVGSTLIVTTKLLSKVAVQFMLPLTCLWVLVVLHPRRRTVFVKTPWGFCPASAGEPLVPPYVKYFGNGMKSHICWSHRGAGDLGWCFHNHPRSRQDRFFYSYFANEDTKSQSSLTCHKEYSRTGTVGLKPRTPDFYPSVCSNI